MNIEKLTDLSATPEIPDKEPPHEHECICGFIDDCRERGHCVCECGEGFVSDETPRITMKHFDWCHSAAARFEDLARTEFSGAQWTHARESNLEAARGMRELAQLIRPLILASRTSESVPREELLK